MDERQLHMGPDAHGHEERDVRVRPIVIFGISLLILSVLVMLAMTWLFDYFTARQARLAAPPSPLVGTLAPVPEPRLEVAPDQMLQELRAEEETLLHAYSWVDRQAGVVRIPIARAMTLLVERGLPFRADGRGAQSPEAPGPKIEGRP